MSLKDGEMQAVSVFGTVVLSIVLFGGVAWFTKAAPEQHTQLGKMTMIEAWVAYKRSSSKQPQKHFKAADPVQKPQGVSHDENKHVDKKPDDKDQKPPKKNDTDPFAKFKHPNDNSDDPVGPVTMPQVGDLSGSINGNAEASKGDPYFGSLLADMQFQAPTIAKTGDDVPIGCFLLQPDGRIRDFLFKKTTNNDTQLAAEAALKRLKKARDEKPQEVPTRLLRLAGQYICISFNLK
jgi:hypothetical protein